MVLMPAVFQGDNVSVSAMMGSVVNNDVIHSVNNTLSAMGSGLAHIPQHIRRGFDEFSNNIIAPMVEATQAIVRSVNYTHNSEEITMVFCQEDLPLITAPMYEAILSHPGVRPHFKSEAIFAWGIETIVREDVAGRLINTGRAPSNNPQEYIEHVNRSTDPYFTPDEILKVEGTRQFVSTFIDDQIESGEMLDPTDYLFRSTMGLGDG